MQTGFEAVALGPAPPLPRRVPPPRRLSSGPEAAARSDAPEVGLVAALVVHECSAVPCPAGDESESYIVEVVVTKHGRLLKCFKKNAPSVQSVLRFTTIHPGYIFNLFKLD